MSSKMSSRSAGKKQPIVTSTPATPQLPDLFIIEVVIEEISTNKVVKTLSYSADSAVRVLVREQKMIAYNATLHNPNPRTLYEDTISKVTLIEVKKPEPPINIGQQIVEL